MKDKTMKDKTIFLLAMIAFGFLVTPLAAQVKESAPDPAKRQVFFGEQHMHTRNSFDAFTAGVKQTWEDAYRFAMGEEVELSLRPNKR